MNIMVVAISETFRFDGQVIRFAEIETDAGSITMPITPDQWTVFKELSSLSGEVHVEPEYTHKEDEQFQDTFEQVEETEHVENYFSEPEQLEPEHKPLPTRPPIGRRGTKSMAEIFASNK